jgi:GNAT superfamily N-acetyltransferase
VLELHEESAEELASRREMLTERQATLRFEAMYDDPGVARARAAEAVDRMLGASARGFVVEDDGTDAGHLVWGDDGEAAAVLDVRLDDPERVGELLPALLDLARADGKPRIGVGGYPGDPSLMAMVALPGFTARATNMLLALDRTIGDPGELELRPMTEPEFAAYFGDMREGYTQELVGAGMSPEAAETQSRTQTAELIPDGLASEGQEFFTGWVGDAVVGTLWLSTERPMAFVYNVEVAQRERGRGYGRALMNAGALWSRDHGHPFLGLNVFAHNPVARALYDSLGYAVTVDYRTVDVPDAG